MPLPVSTFATAPRFTDEQLARIVGQPLNRDGLLAALGPPDLRRDGERMWIYTWSEDFGAWELVPLTGTWSDNRAGPVESHRFVWTFQFDEAGATVAQEFARDVPQNRREAVCTSSGICIHHHVSVDDAEFGYRNVYYDKISAVSLRGAARERRVAPSPRHDQCIVALWPDAVWDSHSGSSTDNDFGVSFRVDDVPPWTHWSWLPSMTFVRFAVPAGEHRVTIRDRGQAEWEEGSSTATFTCRAGEQLYLALGGAGEPANHFPVQLRTLDAAQAQPMLDEMGELLPPD